MRERLLAVGRIAQPEQHAARPADRLRCRGAMDDDRAVAAVGLQAPHERFRAALRAEDRLAPRILRLRVEPADEPAQLLDVEWADFEPQPATETDGRWRCGGRGMCGG